MKKRGSGWGFWGGLVVGLALATGAWYFYRHMPAPVSISKPPGESGRFPDDPSRAVNGLLGSLHEGLERRDLLKLLERPVEMGSVDAGGRRAHSYRETYRLPRRWTAEELAKSLASQAVEAGARFSEGAWRQDPEGRAYEAVYGFAGGWNPVTIVFLELKAPRLALVIDDAGYKEGRDLGVLWGLKIPATLAVIPGLGFSTPIAEKAPEFGWEVICHMPMEGHEVTKPGTYRWFLRRNTPPEEVNRILVGALTEIPHCRGLNNHMGSHATEEKDLMLQTALFLREKGLFFLDSRTSDKTVAIEMMHQVGVAAIERHIFLDNEENEAAIHRQLNLAVAKAKKKGYAVAIGHFRTPTLKALAKLLPAVRESGVKLVYLSELVE